MHQRIEMRTNSKKWLSCVPQVSKMFMSVMVQHGKMNMRAS